jgi:phosphoribosylaminoimidazolecarboxamide formyltransferase/IMP cyclohydrolase
MDAIRVERALLSVSDKTGITEFARALTDRGIGLLSTGGTSRMLQENKIPVTSVDSFTGHPEIMDGRVKTLHPKIHGGILAIRDNPLHQTHMGQNHIKPIDLVVVNLYPFRQTVARSGVTIADAIENIDIGGPAMVRSAAKNHAWVAVIVDPGDYAPVLAELSSANTISLSVRKRLAVKAFRHTAEYDSAISRYLSQVYNVE